LASVNRARRVAGRPTSSRNAVALARIFTRIDADEMIAPGQRANTFVVDVEYAPNDLDVPSCSRRRLRAARGANRSLTMFLRDGRVNTA
jgi:hypothetical protein